MKIKVLLFLILLAMTGLALPRERGVLVHRLIVQPSSKLIIDGKTNINSFRCAITQYCGRDTLELREGLGRKPVFTKGYVGLEASRFDCGMQVMTQDFWETVNSRKYPIVSIEFISFEKIPRFDCGAQVFQGALKISLSGVTREYDVNCTIETEETGLIHLKGGRVFTFSDFNLEPPVKMMGLIKVQEKLEVNFHLVLLLDTTA